MKAIGPTRGGASRSGSAGFRSWTFLPTDIVYSDMVVVVLLAIASAFAHPLLDATSAVSFEDLRTIGNEMLGSVALGVNSATHCPPGRRTLA